MEGREEEGEGGANGRERERVPRQGGRVRERERLRAKEREKEREKTTERGIEGETERRRRAVPGGGEHLEDGAIQLEDRDVQGTATKVKDEKDLGIV